MTRAEVQSRAWSWVEAWLKEGNRLDYDGEFEAGDLLTVALDDDAAWLELPDFVAVVTAAVTEIQRLQREARAAVTP